MNKSPIGFVKAKLKSEQQIRMFLSASKNTKIGLVVNYMIGDETERYAAEPVYSKTGKGRLASKGVEGMKQEEKLIHDLTHTNRLKTLRFIKAVEHLVKFRTKPGRVLGKRHSDSRR